MPEVAGQETFAVVQASTSSSGPSRAQVAWVIALLAVLVIGLAGVVAIRTTGTKLAPTQQWQYQIVSPSDYSIESDMNELGKQGWKLVFARRAMSGPDYNRISSYEMIFKRPISTKTNKDPE